MKRVLTVLLCAAIVFCFAACGTPNATVGTAGDGKATVDTAGDGKATVDTADDGNAAVETTEEEEKVVYVKAGEKIVSETMEITINSVELTYDVLPDDTSGFYTHYAADAGEVYISIDADVYNKAKQNLSCDEIGKVTADYNGGYTYKGFVVVKDDSTGFTYANISSIAPLATQGIKWLVKCPQEIDETEYPLFLEFEIMGETFVYTIR